MEKILIVEDDKFLKDLLIKQLEDSGYAVIHVMDGEEGLKKVKEEKPDLILLDLVLPGIGGFEFLEEVKKDSSENKNIPVLILSNLGQEDDIKKGISLGAEDFLIKAHYVIPEIVAKIKETLAKK
ncbi:response regulator [Patescibacteria group bacterium]|nr:response regulator [Patescibacteria group bacterium]MBU2219523.1 response regulator [Patescibacteria group bacterium]MBU2264971.1 response regulator [Patescibacteria group bacterium]